MKESGSAQVQSPHARESKEIGGGKGGRGAAQTALMAREAEVRAAVMPEGQPAGGRRYLLLEEVLHFLVLT